jgi:Putative DNA-binding domain
MHDLAAYQAHFIATINDGPDALAPDMFAGPIDRVLLGLQAHANTISYARLITLEDSFPLTREALGEQVFNRICRDYCASDPARCADNNNIGAGWPDFLSTQSVATNIIDLARIEWAYLQSYHAPDAAALSAADLAAMDPAELPAQSIGLHPSLRWVELRAPLSPVLCALLPTVEDTLAVATIRPSAEVLLLPINRLTLVLLQLAAKTNATIGNLLEQVLEHGNNDDPIAPILNLIGSGALIATG